MNIFDTRLQYFVINDMHFDMKTPFQMGILNSIYSVGIHIETNIENRIRNGFK